MSIRASDIEAKAAVDDAFDRVVDLDFWKRAIASTTVSIGYSDTAIRLIVNVFHDEMRVNAKAPVGQAVVDLLHGLAHCACRPRRERHDAEFYLLFSRAVWELTGERPFGPSWDVVEATSALAVEEWIARGHARSDAPWRSRRAR